MRAVLKRLYVDRDDDLTVSLDIRVCEKSQIQEIVSWLTFKTGMPIEVTMAPSRHTTAELPISGQPALSSEETTP